MAAQEEVNEFWECQFLSDPNEIRKHEKVTTKNADVLQQKYTQCFQLCSELLNCSEIDRKIKEGDAKVRKMTLEKEILESKLSKGDEACRNLQAECQVLSSTVSEKQDLVPELAQENESLKQMHFAVKNDIEAEKKQAKKMFDSIIVMKDLYKKHVGCHIRLLKSEDESEIYLFTFASTLKSADNEPLPFRSAKFRRIYSGPSGTHDPKCTSWKLLETNPPLPNFEKVAALLDKSQDVPGLLVHLRTQWKSSRLNS
ncbi:hypothetical protein FOCC_FOCC009092 [Frankliniella occidentalis]|uniref:Uncharacterized protein LOC113217406 n=1 Tax=Frankliniella occidentalis TaxID=133901 RepID=A0A6J1THU6_FRAOC|nr:uncharacterized protein LOC113217406 [Frankliniella occidentalis]KAE8744277.1 hypothetical protein FOCC_FOCC009092 [Frankliniella occidentalis]